MRKFRLVVITGLPGTGKTTLARELAHRHALPLICKDTIKEPLLDRFGPEVSSRALSDIAFAIMFAQAKELLAIGSSVILEGNFRCGEHEVPLLNALPPAPPDVIQVLCRADESQRRSVLVQRSHDPTRHPGHQDALRLQPAADCDSFLNCPSERLLYRVGFTSCESIL